jgi:glycosyltransferase involved in cell wall biosynthesis
MTQGAEAGPMLPSPPRPTPQGWIALLGRASGAPADGVEDYCAQLRDAFLEKGVPFEMLRMPLAERSWRSALAWLRERLAAHDPAVVLLQYNALSWSRRGFSVGALLVLRTLKRHTSRVGVIFHDAGPYPGTRLRDRIRRRVQIWVMRRLIKNSAKSICALPADCLPWFPSAYVKNKFALIPIGSGMAQISGAAAPALKPTTKKDLRIAVFGLGLNNLADLSAQLARIVSTAAKNAGPVRLAVFGLGALESESALRKSLEGTAVTLEIDGILGSAEVCERLRQSSVQLFIRSGVSACRSSVVAGICCGLPIVGWQDWDTAYPITEAGLRTAPCGDEAGLIRELASVLTDGTLRSRLALRSAEAAEKYFSWRTIATKFQDELCPGVKSATKR